MVATWAKPIPSGIATTHNRCGDVHGGHMGQADPVRDSHSTQSLWGCPWRPRWPSWSRRGYPQHTIPAGMSVVAMLAKLNLLGISTAHNPSRDVHGGHTGQVDSIGDIHGTISQRGCPWWPRRPSRFCRGQPQHTIPAGMSVAATLAKLIPSGIPTAHNPSGDIHSSQFQRGCPWWPCWPG